MKNKFIDIGADDKYYKKVPVDNLQYNILRDGTSLKIFCDFINFRATEFKKLSRYLHPGPPFSRIFLFKNGGATVTIGADNHKLYPGNIYLLPSNQTFDISYKKSLLRSYHLNIYTSTGLSIFDSVKGIPCFDDTTLFERAVHHIENNNTDPAQIIGFEIAYTFLEPLINDLIIAEKKSSKFEKITSFIQRSKASEVNIDILAKKMVMSRAALSKSFIRAMGVPLKSYIMKTQLDKARKMLSETDLTILQISDEIGYTDPTYFHRLFKSKTGITPYEYRKGISEINN